MSVKLLENTSFSLLSTNPKLTTNVKIVVDTKGGIFLESFDANEELSKSKYKAFPVSGNSLYEYDLSRFYGNGKISNDIIFEVFRENSDISVYGDFSKQYESIYNYGAESISSLMYSEEFGILAPIWLEKNIPDYFVIFRVDGPVSINNIGAIDENSNTNDTRNPLNFKNNILDNATIIKTIDLSLNSNIGKYIRNYINSKKFPNSPLNFKFNRDEASQFNGIDLKDGGFTSKSEFLYNDYFAKDTTIIEDDYFITNGFERNNLACANILNLQFLFDDKDIENFTINRYFGLYVNSVNEGVFQVSGESIVLDVTEVQLPKITDSTILVPENTKNIIQTNSDGIKIFIDKDKIITEYEVGDLDNSVLHDNEINHYDFLPSTNDVNTLSTIFYIQDKNENFHNLKSNSNWTQGTELKIKDKLINWKDFTGVKEPLFTTPTKIVTKKGKASTFIDILGAPPIGDRYFATIINRQIYELYFDSIVAGDIVTITDNNSISISVPVSSNNISDLINDIKNAWETFELTINPGAFDNFILSIDTNNNIIKLIIYEKDFSGIDINFSLSVNLATIGFLNKVASSDLSQVTIVADNTFAPNAGRANGLYFSTDGTLPEIAMSMARAFNNIQDRFFEATAVGNIVVLVSRLEGLRFNDISIGRDRFLYSGNTIIKSNAEGIFHPDFIISKFEGGSNSAGSRITVDIETFDQLSIKDRYIKTIQLTDNDNDIAKIKEVSYYIEEPIKNTNGEIIGYNNFDKYCTIIVDDKYTIYSDSLKHCYIYELFKVPFGRFSIFPINNLDTDFYSNEYGNERELNIETEYYKDYKTPIEGLEHPDIIEFSKNKEFTTLQDLLQPEDSLNALVSPKIESEYIRLKENYIPELAAASRIMPYINKWVYRNGKNVRDIDYRLTSSDAFGITNYSPSIDEFIQDPLNFTHEWYYLHEMPRYMDGINVNLNIKELFSYFPERIDITSNGLLNINTDYFTDYFTVDYFNSQPTLSDPITKIPVDKQLRYSIFEDASIDNFATSFFRGIKIIVKERVESINKINYNLQNIKFKKDTRFNDYKFTAILIPHNGSYNGIKKKKIDIEFIENRKFKSIVLLIFAEIDDITNKGLYSNDRFIDRTLLYSLKSKYKDAIGMPLDDIILSGAIGLKSTLGSSFILGKIAGIKDGAGDNTNFLDEIKVTGNDKTYSTIDATVGIYNVTFKVLKVISDNSLTATDFSNFQPISMSTSSIQAGEYKYIDGGYNIWNSQMNNLSFANIASLINVGTPDIKYTTIMPDGSISSNLFAIELQTANHIIKPSYLKIIDDNNKPVNFNTKGNIGYKLQYDSNVKLIPIFRHSGKYQPKINNIIKFIDPYISSTFIDDWNLPDAFNNYKMDQIKKLIRDKNTQFNVNEDFGIIKNLFYHKINEYNTKGILELSSKDSLKPLYPLIGEIAIDKEDKYIFLSNWDAGYFKRYITKTSAEDVIGTRSIIDKKAFMSSKIMKIIDDIQLETFNSISASSESELNNFGLDINKPDNINHIIYLVDNNKIIIDIYIEKRLIEKLSELGIQDYFAKFIKPSFGYGDENSINDDVTNYIKYNILSRYKIDIIDFYFKKSQSSNFNVTNPILNTNISDADKIKGGYQTTNQYNITKISDKESINIRLIYSISKGYNYSFAPSIKITKK